MRQIFLEDAQPGDEVAKPVKTDRGMMLVKTGTKLSVSLIDNLRRRGVKEVVVEGDDPNAPPPKTLDELLAEMEERFEGLENNRMMMAIKNIAREHLVENMED
ncbi:MAG: hypothetical protein O7G87_10210 [bacterium]|nr:hypothetical protein [bacterium]